MKIETLTKMTIGLKFEMAIKNGIQLVCNRNRMIQVSIENDLYSIYSFTVKGINLINEKRVSGIFAEQLNSEIIKSL